MADATYETLTYHELGGARYVIASGGSLDVESGGEIDIESGGSLKIAGVDVSTSFETAEVTNSDLVLESLNAMTIKLNDIDALQLDNAAISGFAAETDTAGNDVYVEMEDAGGTATAARTGGLYNVKTGDGSAGAAAVIAGAGGAMAQSTGAGGAATGTAAGGAGGAYSATTGAGGAHSGGGATGAGGAGGSLTLTASAGGATSNVGSDNGGAAGTIAITGSAGGNASAGTGDGGAGSDITLTVGAGGTSAGGVAGATGIVKISGGCFDFANAQTIAMNDAEVALTRVPGTPVGTELVSNVLFVDAESGATEDLLLPPEADCNGLVLFIRNTGGESIVVKEDGDSTTIVTIATGKSAIVACDGTAWVNIGLLA